MDGSLALNVPVVWVPLTQVTAVDPENLTNVPEAFSRTQFPYIPEVEPPPPVPPDPSSSVSVSSKPKASQPGTTAKLIKSNNSCIVLFNIFMLIIFG